MKSPKLDALKAALDLLDDPNLPEAQRKALRTKVRALHEALTAKEKNSIDPNSAQNQARKGGRTLAQGLAEVSARVKKEGLRAELAAIPAGFTVQDRVGRQILATIGTTTLLLDPTEAECLTLASVRGSRDVQSTLADLGMRRLRAGLPPIPKFDLATLAG